MAEETSDKTLKLEICALDRAGLLVHGVVDRPLEALAGLLLRLADVGLGALGARLGLVLLPEVARLRDPRVHALVRCLLYTSPSPRDS